MPRKWLWTGCTSTHTLIADCDRPTQTNGVNNSMFTLQTERFFLRMKETLQLYCQPECVREISDRLRCVFLWHGKAWIVNRLRSEYVLYFIVCSNWRQNILIPCNMLSIGAMLSVVVAVRDRFFSLTVSTAMPNVWLLAGSTRFMLLLPYLYLDMWIENVGIMIPVNGHGI